MQVTELKSEGLDLQLQVILPAEAINKKIQQKLSDIAKNVKMDGFRAGKAPAHIINKRFYASAKSEVLEHEIEHSIDHVVKDKNLSLAMQPRLSEVKFEEAGDLSFVLSCELMPKIEMPDFSKISIEQPALKPADADIEEEIATLAKLKVTYGAETKKAAAIKDKVIIDAVGSVDGKEFAGGKLKDFELVLGSKVFIDTFEEQLVGAKAGSEVSVNVTFPENYHEKSLAGKKALFEVKVLSVHKPEEAKIDDEFAKVFGVETLEKLKEQIVDSLVATAQAQVHTIMKMKLFDQLDALLKFEAPKSLVENERQLLLSKTAGVEDAEEMLQSKSPEEIEAYYTKLSLRRVRIGLLLAEYIKVKALRLEQEDIIQAVRDQIQEFPQYAKEIMAYYQNNPKAVESIKGSALEEKAVRKIFTEEIKLKKQEYSADKLKKWLETESNHSVI